MKLFSVISKSDANPNKTYCFSATVLSDESVAFQTIYSSRLAKNLGFLIEASQLIKRCKLFRDVNLFTKPHSSCFID